MTPFQFRDKDLSLAMPAGDSGRGLFLVLRPFRAVEIGGRKEKQAEFKSHSGNGGHNFARVDTFRPRGVHFGRDVIASLSRSDAGVDEGRCGNEGRVDLRVGSARQLTYCQVA